MADESTEPTTENTEDEHSEEDDESSDNDLYVRDTAGDGRPVVLIHGWPLASDSWSEQIPVLREKGYRVVAYDRRGFGQSDPGDGYDYDRLTDDLHNVITSLELSDVTLVGFSMGGGEVARYASTHGTDNLRSVVFAASVTPFLQQGDDNEDGPLTDEAATEFREGLEKDRDEFFDGFTTDFFTAGDDLKVDEDKRAEALELCKKSDEEAALGCMEAWATTDFRDDLAKIDVPALVIHGDSDGIVPLEGSGRRTHEAIEGSEIVVLEGAPHGCNVSHAQDFNQALLDFLEK